MELSVQAKVLKVIEDKKFRRLGGVQEKVVNVRVIAASNRDLTREVKNKRFRDDLFYRLNVMPVMIPSLRELKEDILPLADYFLESICHKLGKTVRGFSPAAREALQAYSWPGNIRELCNLVERSVIVASNPYIEPHDLGLSAEAIKNPRSGEQLALGSLEEMEKEHIRRVLLSSGKNLSKAAEILGITRATLYSKIRKYELNIPS
jgi:two-component system response regulator AtoC